MQGYQLTFFTQQDRMYGFSSQGDWLVKDARKLGVGGATHVSAAKGFGRHDKLHSVHFIELAEHPIQVTMARASMGGIRHR